MLEKPEGTITKGQSINTGNIRHTTHRMKTNKTQKHNKENQTDDQHGPHQAPRLNPVAREG